VTDDLGQGFKLGSWVSVRVARVGFQFFNSPLAIMAASDLDSWGFNLFTHFIKGGWGSPGRRDTEPPPAILAGVGSRYLNEVAEISLYIAGYLIWLIFEF